MTRCRVRPSGFAPPMSSPDCVAEITYETGALAAELSATRGTALGEASGAIVERAAGRFAGSLAHVASGRALAGL